MAKGNAQFINKFNMLIKKQFKCVIQLIKSLIIKNRFSSFRMFLRSILSKFQKLCGINDPNSKISLYPLNHKIDIIEKPYLPNSYYPEFTIIMPVYNEEKNILDVLGALEKQTTLPKQIIIIDGGSKDSTVEKIQNYQKSSVIDILLIKAEKGNIGFQRNLGIDHAKTEIIVNIDAGTFPDIDYLTNLIGPFYENETIDLVSGVYYLKSRMDWSHKFAPAVHFSTRVEPYGACIAYKRKLALEAGKYPEYVTYAGEENLFIYKYKKLSKHWVFNKAAFMIWDQPPTLELANKKIENYNKANFEIGLWPYFYLNSILQLNLVKLDWCSTMASYYEYYKKSQAMVEIQRRNIKGIVFIFALHGIENKESNELREIAFRYIEQNYKVVYINSKSNLSENKKVFYNIDHTLLELIPISYFNFVEYMERYSELNEKINVITNIDNSAIYNILKRFKAKICNCKIYYLKINSNSLKYFINSNELFTSIIYNQPLHPQNIINAISIDKFKAGI